MTRSMTSSTEKRLLELIANMVGFEYLMYVPVSFPHRSGLLYQRENARLAVWNPLVDDGDLFRLAVAAPAVNLHEIINSVSQSCRDSFEIRCAIVREAFVQALASVAVDSCASDDGGSVSSGICSKDGRR